MQQGQHQQHQQQECVKPVPAVSSTTTPTAAAVLQGLDPRFVPVRLLLPHFWCCELQGLHTAYKSTWALTTAAVLRQCVCTTPAGIVVSRSMAMLGGMQAN